MPTAYKQKQVRITIDPETEQTLASLSECYGQSEPWVINLVCAAGLRALEKAGYAFPFPLVLKVSSEEEEVHERRAAKEASPPKRRAA